MAGPATCWKAIIASCVLMMVSAVHAEVLYEQDGIELRGTAQIVRNEIAICDAETVLQTFQMKRSHGQPLHIWQLNFSVHNGSGQPLQHIAAHFNIRSKLPPCSNWYAPRVRASSPERVFWGQMPGPVFWGDSLEGLEDSNIEPGAELRGTVFALVFHEHRPTFENLSVNFKFAEQTTAAGRETVSKAGKPADSADEKAFTLDRTDESPSGFSADQTCIEQPEVSCWRELDNQPQCYVWDDYQRAAAAIMTWSGECSGGWAQGGGTLTSDWDITDPEGYTKEYKEVSKGQLHNGKKHGHWSTYVTSEAGGDWYRMHSWKGPYVNGTRHGQWYFHRRLAGYHDYVSYVDGKRHGPWSREQATGSFSGGPYLANKKHGHWYYYYDDGGRA